MEDEHLGVSDFPSRWNKIVGVFDWDQVKGVLLVDPAPSEASNIPLRFS